jgi:sulfatase modifying factor 1
MKNCLFVYFFSFLSLPVFSQQAADLKSIKNKINKTNKVLAAEFAAIKLIPAKTFFLQEHEGHDSLSFYTAEKDTVDSFYISPYEVTNKQYKEFIYYVQDSILRHLMGFEKEAKDGSTYIDWKKKIDMKEAIMQLENATHDPERKIAMNNTGIILKPASLSYAYKTGGRSIRIPVMPDVDDWKKDYPYSYNEPMFTDRFYNPAFDNYPVTGVSFYQAQAYCQWKSQQLKKALAYKGEFDITIALPTLYQWEAAAVTGYIPDSSLRPGSMQFVSANLVRQYQNKPIKTNSKNIIEFDCNFFSIQDANGYVIKNPGDDGEVYTMQVNAYKPNINGLYNIKGNVAEWTVTNGDECYGELKTILFSEGPGQWDHFKDSVKKVNPQAVIFTNPMNSFLDHMKKTKIVKGGSWKSAAFYIQPGVHQFYDPSAQDGGIGFRYVVLFQTKTK